MEPFESFVRDRLGALLAPGRLGEAPRVIRDLVRDPGAVSRATSRRCAATGSTTSGTAARRVRGR